MPEILSVRQITFEFSDLAARTPIVIPEVPLVRSPGLHLSDVLTYIARKIGKLGPGDKLEEEYPLRMAMGHMWEEWYFSFRKDYLWQPGERTIDSISMNADGLGLWGDDAALVDTKCTEKKVRSGEDWIDDNWIYMHQARGYCYGYGPRVFVWPVLHYRGHYDGKGPVCMEYTVRFSDSEIDQTWAMVTRYRDEILDDEVQVNVES